MATSKTSLQLCLSVGLLLSGLSSTPALARNSAPQRHPTNRNPPHPSWQPQRQGQNYPTRGDRRPERGLPLPDLFQIRVDPFQRRPRTRSPRETFEKQLKAATPEQAVRLIEAWQVRQFKQYLGLPFEISQRTVTRRRVSRSGTEAPIETREAQVEVAGVRTTAPQIAQTLAQLSQLTGKRSGLLYVASLKDELQLLLIPPRDRTLATPSPQLVASLPTNQNFLAQSNQEIVLRDVLKKVDRKDLLKTAKKFRREVIDPGKVATTSYLKTGQQLYDWLVRPLEPQLQAQGIDTLLFAMDSELRSLPLAALHDGERFLIEKYGVALIPSFELTETGASTLKQRQLLAMGISESTQGQTALPAVPVELSALANHFWQGQSYATLNQDSTLANLRTYHRQSRYGIIHLATHAEFNKGAVNNSFIQFWDRKLTLDQVRTLSQELRWPVGPSVDLLVLSACQTAVGNDEAELGFAGSALNAGVKSTVASLWRVNDEGTLGVMSKFYEYLKTAPTKVDALRQAQMAMLKGQVQIKADQLHLSDQVNVSLPTALMGRGDRTFTHPYFWSGYTVVGNWN